MGNNSIMNSGLDSTFRRTSVSVDEAVAILLGWVSGPVAFLCTIQHPTDEERECFDSLRFDLKELIEDEESLLVNAFDDAKVDKLRSAVITEKQEALSAFRVKMGQAKTCLCDIDDELNRGDQSALRIDTKLSSTACRYITLSSLDQWARKHYDISIIEPLQSKALTDMNSQERSEPQQENEYSPKGGLSKTKTVNLYTTFAFLVEALAEAKPGYKSGSDPNHNAIAKRVFELATKANNSDELTGQSAEAIKQRIEDAMTYKLKKLQS